MIKELIHNNILVEDDRILTQKIKLARLNTRFCSDVMHLTIAPTIACNFACPYCYENNISIKKSMNIKVQSDIIKFIESNKKLRDLHIDWYGGEPLLAFDTIISLTKQIQKLHIDNFNAAMVTNGYLLDLTKIKRLKELNITRIQITIDGLEKTHNERRPHKTNNNSFKQIIKNLTTLYEVYPEIQANIRVNIDKKNASEFFDLNEYLIKTINNPSLGIYPAYITEFNPCKTTFCMLNRMDQANFVLNNFNKYPFEQLYYPVTALSECTARFQNSFVIGVNGEIYKCWCDIGIKDKEIGNIKDGIINTNLYTQYMSDADPLYDTKCLECSYFPVCNGGCVFKRLKKQMGNKIDVCTIQKNNINDFMKLYYVKKEANS